MLYGENMLINIKIFLWILILCSSCIQGPSSELTNEEYRILSLIINQRFVRSFDTGFIVLDEYTYIENEDSGARSNLDKCWNGTQLGYYNIMLKEDSLGINYKENWDFSDLIKSYKLNNSGLGKIDTAKLNVDLPCLYFDRKYHDKFLWDYFHTKYPNGIGLVRFSRVGFNESQTEAILWVEMFYGELDATRDYYYLKKNDGIWEIEFVDNCGVA